MAILLIEPAAGLAMRLQDSLLSHFPSSLDLGVARSLREAMQHLCTHHVDLVLMDMTLPDYKGIDAVRALRTTAPSCALVVFSAAPEDRMLLDALQAGAHEVFSAAANPLPPLRSTIERAIIRAATPPEPTARVIHDLNNAMTSINGFAEILVTRLPADDPARAAADQIRQACLRAASLLKTLASAPNPSAASEPAAALVTRAA